MSRRITAGNDAPFRWAVKLQGKPFELSGKDVKVYVINSRGEIPVAQLTIEGHEVSGVFEGRYQTRLGEHSLVLRVNEGRPEMKTATVANVFELVQWSADAGGSDEGDVIVAPVLIESELSIGGGGRDITIDTELSETSQNAIANATVTAELTKVSEELKKKLSVDVVIAPTNDAQVLMSAFKTYDLANNLNVPMQCLIKKERSDEDYMLATLIVEDYRSVNAGYRLTFTMYGNKANAMSGGKIDEQSVYSPDVQSVDNILSYLYNEQYGYVIPLGAGNLVFPKLENKVKEMLKGKVDAEEGKGLSTNDFTDELKEKVSNFKIDEVLDPYSNNAIMNAVVTRRIESVENSISKLPKTPNWLANQGEDGYIQNRTHWVLYIGPTYQITAERTFENLCPVNGVYDVGYSIFTFENVKIDGTPKRYTSEIGYELVITGYGTFGILNDSGILLGGITYWGVKEVQPLSEIYIPDTIARKSELTQLSSQVGTLSEKVDNLPSGESSMFEAIYGETPFADLWNAYQSNKHVVVRSGKFVLSLVRADEALISFSAINNENVYSATCNSSNIWSQGSVFQTEKAQNKVTSLSDKSTNTQYPSAKAVYEALQNVGGGEPSQYIKEATTSADGNTLTLIKKDNTQVVFSPSGGGESSGSNEWKCVFEGRPAVGTKNWEFRTFSDGTSLKATEVIIQVLCDKTSTANATGYVQINSTLNKTLTAYGTIALEATAAKEAEPLLYEMRLKASPCFMIAEISASIKATAGLATNVHRNGGHLKTFEIYEDIVYVKVYTTGVVTENVGLLKIYAR